MKRKTILRLITDVLMSGLILFSMANRLTENAVHEIIGVLMFVFFVQHQVLNWRWYRYLVKGRYDLRRAVNALVNGLLLLAFVVLIGSSVMISRTLFSFPGTDSSLTLRQVHTTMAYWFLVLSAIHLGIQWPRLVRMLKTVFPRSAGINVYRSLRWVLAALIVGVGIYASFERDVGSKLFMAYAFDFWDFERSVTEFFIFNLAIIGQYAVIAHTAMKFCLK